MVPRTVLSRSGPISVNTVRPVNTVQPRTAVNNAGPMKNVINNAYSTARRPFNKITAANNSNFTKKVNTVKGTRVNTARPKAVLKLLRNKFLTSHVSQMCDNKNSVLFTDTECVVLSPDFKLTGESHVLLKVPRKDNMYSVDLKNVVPQGGRKPALSFMRPFECLVTILNAIDHLGSGPNWLFDIDVLRNSTNYKPVVAGNQSNGNAGTKACDDAGKARVETVPGKDYILLPLWTQDPPFSSSPKDSPDAGFKPLGEEEKKDVEDLGNEGGNPSEEVHGCADDLNIPDLEEIGRFSDAENDDSGADINNLDTYFQVSPVPTTRIHKDHPLNQVIGDLQLDTQTR
ncbi:hypothetical protein Tco_0226110 [Tanacetum coccineum]